MLPRFHCVDHGSASQLRSLVRVAPHGGPMERGYHKPSTVVNTKLPLFFFYTLGRGKLFSKFYSTQEKWFLTIPSWLLLRADDFLWQLCWNKPWWWSYECFCLSVGRHCSLWLLLAVYDIIICVIIDLSCTYSLVDTITSLLRCPQGEGMTCHHSDSYVCHVVYPATSAIAI